MAQVLSEAGLKQFHTAETEKYAHVTYFFDGGRELRHEGEDWELIPSRRDAEVMVNAVFDSMTQALTRGERIERSFAHLYDTGGMRRVHLRGKNNIAKRALIQAAAFNLSLILRQMLGVGTARQAADLVAALCFAFLQLTQAQNTTVLAMESPGRAFLREGCANTGCQPTARDH